MIQIRTGEVGDVHRLQKKVLLHDSCCFMHSMLYLLLKKKSSFLAEIFSQQKSLQTLLKD